jgi:hypothetical protein
MKPEHQSLTVRKRFRMVCKFFGRERSAAFMPLQRAQVENRHIKWRALNMSVLKRHKRRAPVAALPRCIFRGLSTQLFILNAA